MSKGVKIALWILAIIIVIAATGYFFGKKAVDKITFSKVKLLAVNFQGLSLSDIPTLLSGGTKTINATIGIDINNSNNFSIPFSKVNIRLFYNGSVIAETSPALYSANPVLPPNGTLALTDSINIILSKADAQLLSDKFTGKNPAVDYKGSLSVFGIPIKSINGSLNL